MLTDIPENEHLTLIFKPTYACNLACPYCYNEVWRETEKARMSADEARRAFLWLCEFCRIREIRSVTVIWHGGEPLLMGASFFHEVINFYRNLFDKAGITVKNVIQTNATLLDEDYIEIFRAYFNSSLPSHRHG